MTLTLIDIAKIAFVLFLMALVVVPIVALFVTPIYQILLAILYSPFMRKYYIRKATKEGHTVKAHLVKQWTDWGYEREEPNRRIIRGVGEGECGRYEYSWNGKTYYWDGKFPMYYRDLPDEITLYFDKNPKYAGCKTDYRPAEYNWKKHYLIITLILMILILLMGVYYVVCL